MILWKKSLDPFVQILPPKSSSFLAIILSMPHLPTSIHYSLYLPTSGKDNEFIEELSQLKLSIEEVLEKYDDPLIYIRGDANTNLKNGNRLVLLNHLQDEFELKRIPLGHNTYHHFMGDGHSDSEIDIILHSKSTRTVETLSRVLCRVNFPEIESRHDVIESQLTIKHVDENVMDDLLVAPRVDLVREKIVWSEDGIQDYQSAVAPILRSVRESWPTSFSKSSVASLLQATNDILSQAATATNKTVNLLKDHKHSLAKKPPEVRSCQKKLKAASSNLNLILDPPTL